LLDIFLDNFDISSTTLSQAFSSPFLKIIALVPVDIFFNPDSTIAWDRTTDVVVPSPATSFVFEAASLTICAPIFSNLSSSSISLATVTPSCTTWGVPQLFSNPTFPPLGPKVVDTARTNASTPDFNFDLASSPYIIFLAAI